MNYINNINYYGDIVIKLTNKSHNTYLNRENKFKLLNFIKDNNFSFLPTVIDCAYKDGIVINKMKKLKNFKEFDKSLANEEFYTLLINTITKFHKLDVSSLKLETFSYKNFFYNLYNNIEHHLYNINLEELDKVISRLDIVSNKCLSHNDLVQNNILYIKETNTLKLIDFDFAMINNNLFDYASFLCESLDDQKDINIYITSLFKERILTPENIKDFKDEIYYQDRLWLIWANYCYEMTKKEEDNNFAILIKNKLFSNLSKFEIEYNNKSAELKHLEEEVQNSEDIKENKTLKVNTIQKELINLKEKYEDAKKLYDSTDGASINDILKHSNIIDPKSEEVMNINRSSREFLSLHANKVDKLETRLLNL